MNGALWSGRKSPSIALVAVVAVLLTMLGAAFATSATAASTRTASTETELRDAITASAAGDSINIIENITVTSEVVVDKSITINGNGLTIAVPKPGVTDAGANETAPSLFRVFRVPSGTVNFTNITVKGGNIQGAGFQIASGVTAYLTGVVISNGRNSGGGGGGLHNLGTTYLERSSVSRNSARFGGGFLNKGTLTINGSSLSENRSEAANGGGGAGENTSVLSLNNSTLSNNQSTEIGGAINNYGGTLRALNSSFTGNVAYGSQAGGAIGNNRGTVSVANTAFAYNFRRSGGNVANPTAYVLDDFGADGQTLVDGRGVSLSYSTYQAALPSAAAADRGNQQYVETGATPGTTGTNSAVPNVPAYFGGGAASPINNPVTGTPIGAAVYRPFLVRGTAEYSGVSNPALAISSWANTEENRGTSTRFRSAFVDGLPVMAFLDKLSSTPGYVALTTSGNDSDLVIADQVGTPRPDGASSGTYTTAGSAQLEVADVYQVQSVTAAGGTLTGASTYGDVYSAGTSVTVVAVPDSGKQFANWIVNGTTCTVVMCPRFYTFTVTENVRIQPVFADGTAPVIEAVSPAGGSPSGGSTITIDGDNLTAGATVTVGGDPCTSVVVDAPDRITCVTPPGTAGDAAIVVTTVGGSDTDPSGFAYVNAPTITTLTPSGGPTEGGTTVTINGTGFFAGMAVTIGGNPCTAVSVTSLTSLTCVAPSGTLGPKDVVATTSVGSATSSGGFAYVSPPTITSVGPQGGPVAGGTTITVDGTGFVEGTVVTIGGYACTPVTIVSGSELTCVTPAGTEGAKTLKVTTPAGSASQVGGFTYVITPTVTDVAPAGGALAGGITITVAGTDFTDDATVTVGGNSCTPVVVVSLTELTCVTPAGTAGTADVDVTTVTGTGTATGAFTYADTPTITDIGPAGGDVAGGTPITITGDGFFDGVTVMIGNSACTSIVVVSPTEMTCVTPPGAHGLVDVVVQTSVGIATDADGYAYVYAPTLTSVLPAGGEPAGGTTITIVGTNLYDGTTVKIGGAECTNVVVTPLTSLTCTTPPGTAGLAEIEIDTTEGSVTTPDAFTYADEPTVTKVVPGGAPIAGGNTVTIEGNGFFGDMTVEIGGAACTDVVVLSPTELTCVAPAGTIGDADVVVTTIIGSDTVSDQFSYIAAPTIEPVGPAGGPLGGGTTLTLEGTGFVEGMTVTVGGQECTSVTVTSPTTATCVTPAGPAGLADVVVTTPAGEATDAGGFTYAATPVIDGASPAGGSPDGGTRITIEGDGFYDGATVTIGGQACTDVVVVSPTELACTTPSGTAGLEDIVVTTPEGAVTDADGFTYAAEPTISTVSPTFGSTSGGNTVTIDGDGFFDGVTVTIGGEACTSIVVVSPTQLTCVSPAGTAGAADVVVTTSEGTATEPAGFDYIAAPTIGSVGPAGGPPGGGTPITITGTNFASGATVTIGGIACVNIVVVSATEITCTTPAGTQGVAEIVVDVPGGGGSVTDPDGFTFAVAPVIDVIAPALGPVAGGTTIQIEGEGYFNGATVTVGGQPCTNVVVTPSGSLTCTLPPGAAGAADVVVTTTEGSNTDADGFLYIGPPTIGNVGPAGGPVAGGTPITIEGTGFVPGMTVTVGGEECTSVSVISATQLTCLTPESSGEQRTDVVVNTEGGSAQDDAAFTYADAPTLGDGVLAGGPMGGGNVVTIDGTGFFDGVTVEIGGNACTPVVVVSETRLTCTAPAGTEGPADIEVTTTEGTATAEGGYLYAPAPTVTTASPTGQPIQQGTPITIAGTGFYPGTSVLIGGVACTNVVFVSSTQITCNAPSGLSGWVPLVISNASGDVTVVDAFYYSPSVVPVDERCPLQIISARPAKKKLPVGQKVTLVKRAKTAAQCRLVVSQKISRAQAIRGDMPRKVLIKVNKRTGKITAVATSRGAKAKIRIQAVPVRAPYNAASSVWTRTWKS